MREYQVRICEGLGVKFPGPTRRQPVDFSSDKQPSLTQLRNRTSNLKDARRAKHSAITGC